MVKKLNKFPSPCGVSFILIYGKSKEAVQMMNVRFPSPCGVSFILIRHY